MTMTIGKNIRKLRLERQITQEELAKRMKISCAAVSKWERGDAFPDITFLMPLAYFFHVSIDELMGYHDAVFEEEISEKMTVIKNRMEENKTEEARTLLLELIHQYPSDLRIFIFYMHQTMAYFDKTKVEIPDVCKDFIDEIIAKIEKETQLLFARHS